MPIQQCRRVTANTSPQWCRGISRDSAASHSRSAGLSTGFHPLDGARYLRDVQHADGTVCRLVAHHTGAMIEADERGLADVLASEFEPASQYWSMRSSTAT